MRNVSGPPRDERYAHATLEGRALAFAKAARRPGVIAVRQPGPVVGREDDERVVVEVRALDGVEDPADRPVDFRDHVAVGAAGLARELVRDEERHVRHRVRDERKNGVLRFRSTNLTAFSVYIVVSCD